MLPDPLEGSARVLVGVAPRVVDIQRGAVIDEPWPAVPHEQVRVLHGSVRVGDERIEPHDVGGEGRIDDLARRRRGGVERERTGQEIHPEVQPAAGSDEIVDLLVGLGVAQRRIDVDPDEIRHG